MTFKQFKASQKIRVIINGVSFYTTAGQVRNGVGSTLSINACCHAALSEITRARKACEPVTGLCGDWAGHQIQMDVML